MSLRTIYDSETVNVIVNEQSKHIMLELNSGGCGRDT